MTTVIISKLIYASRAWWGFFTTADQQRLNAFIRRGVRAGLYVTGDRTFTQMVEDANSKVFRDTLSNPDHTLHQLLPKQITHECLLRPRRRNRELLFKTNYDDYIIV